MSAAPASPPRVVVVGAGITGLAVAWHLRADAEVVVLEAGDRIGGAVRTVELAGVPFDVGADAYLARQPEMVELVAQLGLDGHAVAPATGRVLLWIDRRLRPLPEHTVLGVPTDLAALARSGALSPGGLARAALEPVLPRRVVPGDRSIADLVGERFGRQVVDRLVEPLLAGVYAGSADRLSVEATAPAVWQAAGSSRSLLRGLRAHRSRSAPDDRPVFQTLVGGLGQVVDALAVGADIRLGARVTDLLPTGGRWEVHVDGGEVELADQVVVTVPAAPAAGLLRTCAPDAARELAGIETADVAVVALAYPRGAGRLPVASGLLVPRSEGRLTKAVTFASRKWPHHADGDRVLVRASVGRVDDRRGLELDDGVLADRVDAELRWALGLTAPAVERRVQRWPAALPQYDLAHVRRVDRIRAALGDLPPGLHLGGASLDGVGLAARARDASRLATAVRRHR